MNLVTKQQYCLPIADMIDSRIDYAIKFTVLFPGRKMLCFSKFRCYFHVSREITPEYNSLLFFWRYFFFLFLALFFNYEENTNYLICHPGQTSIVLSVIKIKRDFRIFTMSITTDLKCHLSNLRNFLTFRI